MTRAGQPVSRAAAVRALDRALIDDVGIPSSVLMEHASHGVADAVAAWWAPRPSPRTLIVCGPGNNGGDGYAVARHLALRGWAVRALPLLPPTSPECVTMHGVAAALDLVGPMETPDLVIDAVFGTGQRAPLALPALPNFGGAPVVALDVPTGIDADTGTRLAPFPAATVVVTIGRLKPCCFLDAPPFALVDIGLEWRATPPEAVFVNSTPWIPVVPVNANKWRRGHVAVRAGTADKAGAAVLACLGALRGGAGLVTLLIERSAWSRLGALPPEVMVADPGAPPAFDVLVAGPGLGRTADAELRALWSDHVAPAVFDADAIRALNGAPSPHPRIITPHAGEAAHLLREDWRSLEGDRFATAARLSAIATTIYKGACPIVTGEPLAVLRGGTPALGAGGSGDLLAGLTGALLANHAAGEGRALTRADTDAVALAAAWLHQAAARGCPVGATITEIGARIPGVRAGP
ncbi:bifunctional NAD(P)H-hydrate repair enzyme [Deltaproteobacteria bacterium]|nr:bifunctional NAD(P)H-hydrate repair enzyme [Deltaproteobacteria bacterium]